MFIENTTNCQWASGSGRNNDLAKPLADERECWGDFYVQQIVITKSVSRV